jgi:hypothetical protein
MAVAIDDRSGSLIVGGEEQPSCGTGPGCSAYPTKQTNIVAATVGMNSRRLFVCCVVRARSVRRRRGGAPPKSARLRWAVVLRKFCGK